MKVCGKIVGFVNKEFPEITIRLVHCEDGFMIPLNSEIEVVIDENL